MQHMQQESTYPSSRKSCAAAKLREKERDSDQGHMDVMPTTALQLPFNSVRPLAAGSSSLKLLEPDILAQPTSAILHQPVSQMQAKAQPSAWGTNTQGRLSVFFAYERSRPA